MDGKFDNGPLLRVEKENIIGTDNYGIVMSKLFFTLMQCVGSIYNMLTTGNYKSSLINHNDEDATYFSKPTENDLQIDWNKMTADEISNLVRASNPVFQGAVTFFRNMQSRIKEAEVKDNIFNVKPGVVIDTGDNLCVSTIGNNTLCLNVLYINEGIFGGKKFKTTFNVKTGEKFGS